MSPTTAPLPRSDAQRAASRLNGSQSHGPTTDAGRRASSRNATKHGFSGDGKNLPPDMAADLLSEIALFASAHHPRTDYEHDLIRRAALGNLRSRRISDTLNALCDDRARLATRLWDETRSSEISSLAAQLPLDPQTAVRQLRRTAEGCDYLADSLDSLAQSLQTHGFLDESQSLHLLNLLGHPEPPSVKDDAHPLHPLWTCLLSLQFDHNPRPLMRTLFRHVCTPKPSEIPPKPSENPPSEPPISPLDHVRSLLPDPSEARADLAQFLQSQIADLEKQGNLNWELYDQPSRESAPLRAAFDTSPETILLNRHLASAERMRKQALDELHRLRKTPVQNEPEPPTPAPQNGPEPFNFAPPPFSPIPPFSWPPLPSAEPSPPDTAPDPASPIHYP